MSEVKLIGGSESDRKRLLEQQQAYLEANAKFDWETLRDKLWSGNPRHLLQPERPYLQRSRPLGEAVAVKQVFFPSALFQAFAHEQSRLELQALSFSGLQRACTLSYVGNFSGQPGAGAINPEFRFGG